MKEQVAEGVEKPKKEREKPFQVYLHKESWIAMYDLTRSYRDRRSIVNAALWHFWRQPRDTQLAFIRSFSLTDTEGAPIETPEQKFARLSAELADLGKALGTGVVAAPRSPAGTRRRKPQRSR